MANCRLCKRGPHDIGGYLQRMNAPGEDGVWECRPTCDADLTQDEALLAAIDGLEAPDAR